MPHTLTKKLISTVLMATAITFGTQVHTVSATETINFGHSASDHADLHRTRDL